MSAPGPVPPPPPAPTGPGGSLLYSDYVNDRAMIEALRLTSRPAHVPPERWPDIARHTPGGRWPRGAAWVHDEVLFVRTHQAFEVWFAQVLHELESVLDLAVEAWARHGAEGGPERVWLKGRDLSRRELDPARFPRLRAARADARERLGPAGEAALASVGSPARVGPARAFPWGRTAEDAAAFGDLLVLATERVQRACMALGVTLPFYDVLATLKPAQFLAFRDRLSPASGFGSGQFRELELLLGLRERNLDRVWPSSPGDPAPSDVHKDDAVAPTLPPRAAWPAAVAPRAIFHHHLPAWMRDRVLARFDAPSLRDLVHALAATVTAGSSEGLRVPALTLARLDELAARNLATTVGDLAPPVGGPPPASLREKAQASMLHLDEALAHAENAAVAWLQMQPGTTPLHGFLDACLALDGAVLQWRDRHIRFVEGIIGTRMGTGGGGVDYLRETVRPSAPAFETRAFPCLWYARSLVQRV